MSFAVRREDSCRTWLPLLSWRSSGPRCLDLVAVSVSDGRCHAYSCVRLVGLLAVALCASTAFVLGRRPRHRRPGSAQATSSWCGSATGGAAADDAATAVFLDEYTPAGALVQSVALPTSISGDEPPPHDERHGHLGGRARAVGGRAVPDPGRVRRRPGTAAVASTSTAATNRVVARVDGTASSTRHRDHRRLQRQPTSGVRSPTTAAASGPSARRRRPARRRSAAPARPRRSTARRRPTCVWRASPTASCYFSTGSGTTGVYAVGSGLPTTGGQVPALLAAGAEPVRLRGPRPRPGVPGTDTLYVADDSASPGGGIFKYSFDGATWTARGSFRPAASGRAGSPGPSSGGVTLYATTTRRRTSSSRSATRRRSTRRSPPRRPRCDARLPTRRSAASRSPRRRRDERARHRHPAAVRDDRQRGDRDADRAATGHRPAELPVVQRAPPAHDHARSAPTPPRSRRPR